jgi:hypothetical protein
MNRRPLVQQRALPVIVGQQKTNNLNNIGRRNVVDVRLMMLLLLLVVDDEKFHLLKLLVKNTFIWTSVFLHYWRSQQYDERTYVELVLCST